MSRNEEPLQIWAGNFGSHRAKAQDIARHSLVRLGVRVAIGRKTGVTGANHNRTENLR
jgi:hypothetical protein